MASIKPCTLHASQESPSPSYASSLSHMNGITCNLHSRSNKYSMPYRMSVPNPLPAHDVYASLHHDHVCRHPHANARRMHSSLVQPLGAAASTTPWLGEADLQLGIQELPHGLDADRLPRHVGIVMDGNERWAQAMGLVPSEGQKKGVQALMNIICLSSEWGLSAFTVFLFTADNCNHSKVEVASLMEVFEKNLGKHMDIFLKHDMKVKVIGNKKQLPQSLQNAALELEEKTSQKSGMKVTFAINYDGQLDMTQALQRLATKVHEGIVKIEDLSIKSIDKELWTSCMEDEQNPDLLIRTIGELRISKFLLHQASYSQIMFLDTYFPAMNETLYAKALASYQKIDKRYGRQETLQLER